MRPAPPRRHCRAEYRLRRASPRAPFIVSNTAGAGRTGPDARTMRLAATSPLRRVGNETSPEAFFVIVHGESGPGPDQGRYRSARHVPGEFILQAGRRSCGGSRRSRAWRKIRAGVLKTARSRSVDLADGRGRRCSLHRSSRNGPRCRATVGCGRHWSAGSCRRSGSHMYHEESKHSRPRDSHAQTDGYGGRLAALFGAGAGGYQMRLVTPMPPDSTWTKCPGTAVVRPTTERARSTGRHADLREVRFDPGANWGHRWPATPQGILNDHWRCTRDYRRPASRPSPPR